MSRATPIRESRRDYPALRGLRLTDEDIACLARQGSIAEENIGRTLRRKLRFRRSDGKQVVRYIRPAEVDRIRHELATLQACRRAECSLRRNNHTLKKILHQATRKRVFIAALFGFRFHGRAIRRIRKAQLSKQNGSASSFISTKEVSMSFLDDVKKNAGIAGGESDARSESAPSEEQRLRHADEKFFTLIADLREDALDLPAREVTARRIIKTTILTSIYYSDKGITAVVKSEPKSIIESHDVREAIKNYRGLVHEYERFENLDVRIAQLRAAREDAQPPAPAPQVAAAASTGL